MASSEDHTAEGEDYEDQEAQELFESFMDITKDAEILQDESNGDVVETKDENTVKEEIPNTIDKPDSASEAENTKEEVGEHNNEMPVNKEGDLSITKRFSKAVVELSDLEKQLSLMISSGAPGNPNDVANPTESGQTDKDVSATISETSQGVPCERVANWDDTDGSASNPSKNQSDTASLEVPETSTNVTDIKDTNLEVAPNTDGTEKQNNDMNEEDPRNCQLNTNNAEILTVDKHEQKSTLLNQPTEDKMEKEAIQEETTFVEVNEGSSLMSSNENDKPALLNQSTEDKMEKEATQEETTFVEVNEGSSLMSSNENDKPTLLNQSTEDKMEKEATQEETTFVEVNEGSSLMSTNENDSEKLEETIMNDTELEHEAVNKSSMNNTITSDPSTDDGQGKSDQEDGPSLANSETESSQQGLGEVDDNGTDSSAPEIEILMTDESGIAERKSLDSLDTDFDDLLPDSPALSDEGIDSDVKSLDDLDDDDATFDSGSMPDLTSVNKARFLGVERNRMSSDSSTVSEREFRTSLSHKSDTDELGKVNMKGHLLKLGGSGLTPRNWRKRWFVLKEDNCLYYYKHSKDKVPCGVIVLCNYSVTKAPDSSKKCCFKLNKGGARTYHFCAVSDDDMRDWMVALMKAASAVSASGTSFQILEGNVHNVSIPALAIKDPDCHGYLSKKGHNNKSWKRRYCVLKNGYLYYYSDMSNTTALGVAKLIGYQIKCGQVRGKHCCFYGSPPDESMRIYHFSAETENDRERWMTRMEESIVKGTTSD